MSTGRVNPALLALRREGVAKAESAQGSLFDRPPAAPEPLSVTQLTNQLRGLVERQFNAVLVTGEITGLKSGSGGHCYFSLKDDGAKLDAVMWRREYTGLKFRLESGMQIVARGKIAVYPPHGKYQLVVDRIDPVGAGALQAAFEQTKARLASEGLFGAERKRAIAMVPRTVAVVTSPTGAVIRDIVNVATRRFPQTRLLLVPAKVQGADAAQSLVYALGRVAERIATDDISVCIVARGGGSMEDLWCFNDERLARAIAAFPVPVVSGVGHEVDFTICDFVADLRAPTPSAAAELVFPVAHELRHRLGAPVARMQRALRRDMTRDRRRLEVAQRALGDGRDLLRDRALRLDAAMARVVTATTHRCHDDRLALQRAAARIERAHPAAQLATARGRLLSARARLTTALRTALKAERAELESAQLRTVTAVRAALKEDRARLAQCAGRLQALSPLAVLTRGYSLTRREGGELVRTSSDVAIGDRIDIRLARGQIRAVVEAVTDPVTVETAGGMAADVDDEHGGES